MKKIEISSILLKLKKIEKQTAVFLYVMRKYYCEDQIKLLISNMELVLTTICFGFFQAAAVKFARGKKMVVINLRKFKQN